jgi:hypothetical protein
MTKSLPVYERADQPQLRSESASLACPVCHREIPVSAAVWREGSDYVAHFCGLDCYDRWRHQS